MKFTGERVVPWEKSMWHRPDLMRDHAMRYAWALPFVAGQNVVDLGCGTGYGTSILSWVADSVVGVDCDQDSILLARRSFQRCAFRMMDLDVAAAILPADLYVAFEVLEHLEDPEALLAKIEGPLIWSLPVNSSSQFHKHVWGLKDLPPPFFPNNTKVWYQLMNGSIVRPLPNLQVHSVMGISECHKMAGGHRASEQEEDLILEILVS